MSEPKYKPEVRSAERNDGAQKTRCKATYHSWFGYKRCRWCGEWRSTGMRTDASFVFGVLVGALVGAVMTVLAQ